MGWADWMIIEQSLEEELQLEKIVREIKGCNDKDVLMQLCVAMAQQNWHHSKMLRQAVNHIASMDSVLMPSD